jgi:hypothetical protein
MAPRCARRVGGKIAEKQTPRDHVVLVFSDLSIHPAPGGARRAIGPSAPRVSARSLRLGV